MILKTLPGNARYMVKYFHKSNLKNLLHSLSSKSPIASMAMALAEAPFQVSQVIKWVKSLHSFENPPYGTRQYGEWFKK